MKASSNFVCVRLNFRVNDLEFQQWLMKPREKDPADFQIIIEHKFLGSFALHEDFVLELSGSDSSGAWKRVTLEELKIAFLDASRAIDTTKTEEEYESSTELLCPSQASAATAYLPRIPVEGDSSHIDRAKKALAPGRVQYQIVGGIGSHGQVWGHATFLVDSLRRARVLLCRAGFLPSSDSEHVLIDSENGWKIRLLENSENRL